MCCLLNSDRLETKSFVSEISGRITKTIALPPAPSKRPKAYGTSSKVRLFPAPVGEDTNRSMQDRYSSIIFLWWSRNLEYRSGGLSSMFENHASLRVANFDWQLYPLGSTRTTLIALAQWTRFWVAKLAPIKYEKSFVPSESRRRTFRKSKVSRASVLGVLDVLDGLDESLLLFCGLLTPDNISVACLTMWLP